MAWAEGLTGTAATTGRDPTEVGDGWLQQRIPPLPHKNQSLLDNKHQNHARAAVLVTYFHIEFFGVC